MTPSADSSDAFARYLVRAGFATEEQVRNARQDGELPLPEALVRRGVITSAQRESIEKKLEEQREGIRRLGPYRLVKKIGAGGMGEVYLAESVATHERVAIKVLAKEHASDPEFVRRFVREATAAAKLEHPNIVRGLSAGEEHGFHFQVMEYCEGRLLERRLQDSGPLPIEEAKGIAIQVARGLGYAHGHGFLHRDIKPSNLLATPQGVVKILDLGLTKSVGGGAQSRLTQTGDAIGTPDYMAPEQARGEREIDGRADLYALGATWFHLVTGRPPFEGASAFEIISRHLTEPVPDPRTLRPDLPERDAAAIRKLMAKKREDRYRDCAQLLAELEAGAPARKRNPAWFAAAAVLALLGIGGVLVASGVFRPSNLAPPPVAAAKPREDPTVDLLRLVDPARDCVVGTWRRENGDLVSASGCDNFGSGSVRFAVRSPLPAEYDLEIVAVREQGNEDFILTLAAGGHAVSIALDGWRGQRRSGAFVDDAWRILSNESAFTAGREARIVCSVRKISLAVSADGRELLRWTELARLSAPAYAKAPDRDGLVVGAIRSVYRIRRIVFIPR